MPAINSEKHPNKRYWKDRAKLKIALTIPTIPTILLLLIILLAVFIRSEADFCNTDLCIHKMARLFGAQNTNLTESEMKDVYDLFKDASYGETPRENYTIEQFQKKYDEKYKVSFNWLDFLNKLIGSQVVVSSKDYVLVPHLRSLSGWINLLSTTSERTLGNCMIWKVVQAQLPYLPKSAQHILKYSNNDTREDFCLKKTNKRFTPSPIEVINTRKLLPVEKTRVVQEIYSDIKSEFINLLKNNNWLDRKDKEILMENVEKTLVAPFDSEFGSLKQQLSQQTINATTIVMSCLENQARKYNLSDINIMFISSSSSASGHKASYMAYEKWLQTNGEEKLPGTNYTSRQLFWIAATYCHIPSSHISYPLFNDINFYSNVTVLSQLNNPNLLKDFNCPLGSRTNSADECPLLL